MKKLYKIYLDFKKISETQRKRELLISISRRRQKEEEIYILENEKSKTYSELEKKLMEDGVSPLYVSQFLNYISGLRDEKKKKERELIDFIRQEEEMRQQYIESKKEADLAEKLYYKVLANEINLLNKKQEKITDELMLIKKFFSEEEGKNE
ncbi:MAG: flagellar FliJ family protein [Candidatus Calescibacterium sp.]|jgi:flagellar export protein FliJ